MATGEEKLKRLRKVREKLLKVNTIQNFISTRSATILCVDAGAEKTIKEEHYFLSGLLENSYRHRKILMKPIMRQFNKLIAYQKDSFRVR